MKYFIAYVDYSRLSFISSKYFTLYFEERERRRRKIEEIGFDRRYFFRRIYSL